MKILIATSKYHPYYLGGGEYSVKRLAEGLKNIEDLEVEVLTFADKPIIDYENGIKVHRIKPINIYWSYYSKHKKFLSKTIWHILEVFNPNAKSIVEYIKTNIKPDLVHFRNIEDFSSSIFMYLSREKIPTIQTLNTYSMIEPSGTLFRQGRLSSLAMLLMIQLFKGKKYFSHYCSAVVGVSLHTLNEHLERGYYKSSIKKVIKTSPEAVNYFEPEKSKNGVVFGYIGNILKTKGLLELIRAFKKTKSNNSQLIIAGAGDKRYYKHCVEEALEDERIVFVGRLKQSDFYPRVDVVIVSSIWNDPYPRVVAESLGYSKPIISSNFGGAKEGIMHNKTGYIYFDQSELINYIDNLTDNENKIDEFKQNIKNELKDLISIDLDEYYKLYNRVIISKDS
ncbi:glycosyltransferase [Ekhidna sp.]|uniref:glycosyltransferase n=1 Tax=Ekhidna sp. TaxID=2608089 RepID=UPI003B514B4A